MCASLPCERPPRQGTGAPQRPRLSQLGACWAWEWGAEGWWHRRRGCDGWQLAGVGRAWHCPPPLDARSNLWAARGARCKLRPGEARGGSKAGSRVVSRAQPARVPRPAQGGEGRVVAHGCGPARRGAGRARGELVAAPQPCPTPPCHHTLGQQGPPMAATHEASPPPADALDTLLDGAAVGWGVGAHGLRASAPPRLCPADALEGFAPPPSSSSSTGAQGRGEAADRCARWGARALPPPPPTRPRRRPPCSCAPRVQQGLRPCGCPAGRSAHHHSRQLQGTDV